MHNRSMSTIVIGASVLMFVEFCFLIFVVIFANMAYSQEQNWQQIKANCVSDLVNDLRETQKVSYWKIIHVFAQDDMVHVVFVDRETNKKLEFVSNLDGSGDIFVGKCFIDPEEFDQKYKISQKPDAGRIVANYLKTEKGTKNIQVPRVEDLLTVETIDSVVAKNR